MRKERFVVSLRPIQYLEELLEALKIVKKELTGDNHSCVLRIFKTLQASYVEVIRSFALMSLKASMMDISQIMIV